MAYTRRKILAGMGSGAAALSAWSDDPPPQREAFSFVQLCDPQLGMGGYDHDVESLRKAVERINEIKPDFVVICGDLVHDADDASFADFIRIRDGLKVPCHCVSGNHDVGREPTAESLERYRMVIGRDWYSFNHKDYAFVAVNTQLWKAPVPGETEKQDAWLAVTLETAAKQGTPVFMLGHYPLFLERLDEPEEYMNLPIARRRELLDLYKRTGVVAVLGGHVHKLVVNEYRGIQLVNGESTSRNFDQRPEGFRLWHVTGPRSFRHEFIAI